MHSSQDGHCFHCGQPLPPADEIVYRDIQDEARQFCCHGCAGVCESIYEAGLEGFYRRTPEGELLSPPPPPTPDVEFLDYDEVQAQFTQTDRDVREITLVSEAIHCAACIWLIEHTLAKIEGVLYAKVNFTNKQIKVRWDNRKVSLSAIVKALNKIGYDATPYDPTESEAAFRKANRDLLYRLGFAGFAMMNVMWFSVALYTGANDDSHYRPYFYWLEFIIATITLAYSGQPFLKGAWGALKAKQVNMDVSISLGILTTYFYSTLVTIGWLPPKGVYFDTLIDFMFLLLIGRYVEAISRNKAVDASRRLADLQPKVARQLKTDGTVEIVPVRRLKKGDEVQILPGDKIPVDGEVIRGGSMVNESMLSGESIEISKSIGDKVAAGSINLDGELVVRVEATLEETTLGRIVHLVEEAEGSKAPIQCTAEKIMPWFVSTTISLAVLSFVYWMLHADLATAVIAGTSVLIITCPCAFGLATPMATAVATGVSARFGILIKNSAVLEILSGVNHFVFDKTGTLTKGQMKVVDEVFLPEYQKDLDQILIDVGHIESRSEHSIGAAVFASLAERYGQLKARLAELDFFQVHPGKGVEGKVRGHHYYIGTANWIQSYEVEIPHRLIEMQEQQGQQGRTAVWVVQDKKVIGILFLEDELREDAEALIHRLKQRGCKVTLLSGDRQVVAQAVAKKLGGMEVIAEVLPQDKHAMIAKLQQQGDKVAMTGDGMNDAPALVRADVGFALGSGTDVSMDSADVVLLNNELLAVETTVALSERTLRTIKQNIASSIAYNLIMVPLAMGAVLTPLIAAISMPMSSLVVVGNAARIRTFYSERAVAKRNRRFAR